MEGFTSVDLTKHNNKVNLSNNEKMYIIKLPKNFQVEELNDIKLKLSKKNNRNNVIYSNDKVEIAVEDVDAFNIMCPITSQKNSHRFAKKFDGAISINEVITKTNNNSNDIDIDNILEGLPIKLAYGKVEQRSNLGINFMPYGSLSTVSELEKRKARTKKGKQPIEIDEPIDDKEKKKKKRSKDTDDSEKKSKKKKD